jgi:hypothetical protein
MRNLSRIAHLRANFSNNAARSGPEGGREGDKKRAK